MLPHISVIIPAYNEGSHVYETLLSVASGDYPLDKIEIVGIDDGSQDDTWSWMAKAGEELGDRIRLIRLPFNQGKRRALYEGFITSGGEVIVTVDSDSLLEANTLRNMVSPFVLDRKVGAVAGNVRVLNRHKGIIPRMMDASFTYSFDFIRASQSRVNTVVCTPGALSAYRRDVIMPDILKWLGQQFLGRPAKIGEDRALTNMVLRKGYHVHFQQDAVVYTIMPTEYRSLCKMLLRWARSNIRETLVMSTFIFKGFRKAPASGARINFILSLYRLTVGEFLKLFTFVYVLLHPGLMGVNVLFGVLLVSLIPALIYYRIRRDSECLWIFPYSLFWLTALSWISLYALFTPGQSSWLTRQFPAKIKDAPPSKASAGAAMM